MSSVYFIERFILNTYPVVVMVHQSVVHSPANHTCMEGSAVVIRYSFFCIYLELIPMSRIFMDLLINENT